MTVKFSSFGLSDIGLVRQNNEDVWMELPEEKFYVLADGMGGHQAGEVAAKEAVRALCQALKRYLKKGLKGKSYLEVRHLIYKAIEHANGVVYKMSRSDDCFRGMGTTLCCLFFHDGGVIYGHVGDSRIYCLRDQKLVQLTQDHSLLYDLVDIGQMNERRASGFLYKNIITKAVGTEPFVEPTVNYMDVKAGDRFLMCSDGLTDLLSIEEMQNFLNQNSDQQKAVEELIACAKAKGGYDNITALLVEAAQV